MPKSTLCRRCGDERHWTGTRWRCSRCYNKWQKNRRETMPPEQREREHQKELENARARRAAWTPEQRAKANAIVERWRKENPEKYVAGHRGWYARNAEYARAAKLAEYRRNPEAFYARNLVRKARLADALCEHGPKCVTDEFIAEVYASQCLYCGAPAQHLDHFYPIARGGLHCVENIVPACQPCNNSKCSRDPYEFWAERTA